MSYCNHKFNEERCPYCMDAKVEALEKRIEEYDSKLGVAYTDFKRVNDRAIEQEIRDAENIAALEALVDQWVPSASRELHYGERFSSDYTKLKLENERLISEIAALEKRVEGLQKGHKCNLVPYGTDGCSECDGGRITLFYNGSLKCLECEHEALTKIKPTAQKEAGNAGA